MNHELIRFALASFVTLLVVVDPFGLVPIFSAVAAHCGAAERKQVITRAILIGFGVAFFFLVAGRLTLTYLGVSVYAFSIAGGILLFATALPMLFGHRAGLQAPETDEQSGMGNDIAVFPLAIPLLSGPGTLTTTLVLASEARSESLLLAMVALALVAVFVVAFLVLRVGERVVGLMGKGGLHVATRVMGIILAALAVQYILNGATGYVHTLQTH